ncbi:uncharacterized protein BX663DRAFT_555564 [Cokeromyces recurvatus]|uniref:uncharacterized protein n=1 Tax=Cokeromyces recurvatus TaxID=90255 RepID=UPI00221FDA83|nr:uncharacterized protein BX663DRAFT_555564 [Cokeromyces recurvatus]KAI7898674.1 hypothetical protein BX663DRAFT_555564 [Cokeromyces recurvatus]
MTTEEIIVPKCQGCSYLIEEGAVVAFGDSLFHVKCFICAKCKECVDDKTNLLLLEDGRPVCDNCSYNCTVCHEVIRDEAIMTGEKAYHSHCFKCISCCKKIEDLIFTQTAKGIYCTACHEKRKAEKKRRKNKTNIVNASETIEKSQQTSCITVYPEEASSLSTSPVLPTPARSRENSPPPNMSEAQVNNISSSILSDLSLSFFDNESTELANLSNSLGVNLSLKSIKDQEKARDSTALRINRASEILQSSLRTSSLKNMDQHNEESETSVAINSSSDVNTLKQELSELRSRMKELETNYKVLQEASQQALLDLDQVKDDLAKEFNVKQQLEFTILSLTKKNGGVLSRKELDKLALFRVELERTCKEMINYRDKIANTIDQNISSSSICTNYQKNLKIQIKSLIQERDLLRAQTKDLQVSRDDVIHEMILLNTKNAELTTMNNDLSRRALEKEETIIITAPNNNSHSPPLSPSQSTDTTIPTRIRKPSDGGSVVCNVSSQNNFIPDQTPTLFRIKKKGSAMFGILGGSVSNTKSESLNGNQHHSSSKPSIYNNHLHSSSVQTLNSHFDTIHHNSGTVGRAFTKNKAYVESNSSLSQHTSNTQQQQSSGDHSFQPMSFLRPVKCGACGDKIWGRSEYRCEGCGFSSHSRCLTKVPQQCTAAALATSSSLELTSLTSTEGIHPSISSSSLLSTSHESSINKPLPIPKKSISESNLFGIDLTERAQFENRTVPLIVEQCIKEVEARGLEYEGIYRKSGGAAQIRAIQLAFEQGESTNLDNEEEFNDICAITSVLKQYFRDLPNPLFTFELYDTLIDIATMNHNEKKIEAFSNALSKLPKAHLDTVILLFTHLNKVFEQSEKNRMSVKNLAMVFAPTLMRHNDPSRDFLDISYKNATIEYILLHTTELFPNITTNTIS